MWRDTVLQFAEEELVHPAWGASHSKRVYETAMDLAEREGGPADEDVLLAVAYLHDVGAFGKLRLPEEKANDCSARIAEQMLRASDFPREKLPIVGELIRGHSFDDDPGQRAEARYFHDADILDFLGAVGVMRLLSVVGLDEWVPDVRKALDVIEQFGRELPGKLVTRPGAQTAEERVPEMREYVEALKAETLELSAV